MFWPELVNFDILVVLHFLKMNAKTHEVDIQYNSHKMPHSLSVRKVRTAVGSLATPRLCFPTPVSEKD